MIKLAPCLILAYRRPILEEVIKPLIEFGVDDIFVAFDGSNSQEVKNFQRQELQAISELCRTKNVNLKALCRDGQLGIALAIPQALDWFFSEVKSGIIIEDDLRFEKEFIEFLSAGLQIYASNVKIENISGNQFFENLRHTDCRVVSYPLIWGWATWRDRWRVFRENPYPKPPATIPKNVIGFWNIGLTNSVSKRVDSWAITYARYQRFNGHKTILPCVNLSSNVGADDVATHSNTSDWSLGVPISKSLCKCSVLTPSEINVESSKTDKLIEDYLYRIKFRHRFTFLHIQFSKINAKLKSNYGKTT